MSDMFDYDWFDYDRFDTPVTPILCDYCGKEILFKELSNGKFLPIDPLNHTSAIFSIIGGFIMYGECFDKNGCNATSHYICKHCGEELCLFHLIMHKIKFMMIHKCYFWRHEI